MNEEEIIEEAEKLIDNCDCWLDDDGTDEAESEYYSKAKETIQGLLDLYKKEKEKNKKLEEVIDMMAEEITDFTGSCPADIFDKEWDEEEGDCEHCKSTDKECFIKYYFKKARGV